MAEYDSAIRISTKVDTSQMQRLNIQIDKSVQKVQQLEDEMRRLDAQRGTNEEMQALNRDIAELTAKLRQLQAEKASLGDKPLLNDANLQRVNAEIAETTRFLGEARREAESMNAAGRRYDEVASRYAMAKRELQALVTRQDELRSKTENTAATMRKAGDTGRKAFKQISESAKSSDNMIGRFNKRVWGLAKRIFIFSLIARAFRAMVNALKEGIAEIAKHESNLNAKLNSFKTAASNLKVALVNIFGQILSVILPILTTVVNAIATAFQWIGKLLSLATGISFEDAAKKNEEFADSLGDTAGAAKKANKELAQFDTLQVLNKKDQGGGGAGATMGVTPAQLKLFNDLNNVIDKLKKKAKSLWDIFKGGFLDGLGDINPRLETIKKAFEGIKKALMEIFGDGKVLAAVNKFVEATIRALGQITGSIASIALTLAANFLGGMEKYLSENTDRIKNALINIFEIRAEIMEKLGDWASALAYIFEAFGDENGQRITAALIGTFTDAYLGAQEFLSRVANSLVDIITRPWIENQEKFRTLFDNYLNAAANVWEGVKEMVDKIFDSINQNYEKYMAPALDKFANALSVLTGKILDFINNGIAPLVSMITDDAGNAISSFGDICSVVIEGVMFALGGLITFMSDVMVGDWQAAWDDICNTMEPIIEFFKSAGTRIANGLYSGLKNVVTGVVGIVNNVIAAIEDMINRVIDKINEFIKKTVDALNSLPGIHISAPKISKVSFGRVSVPSMPATIVPELAEGAVIRGGNPFLAILGDQRSGQTNIETPLDTMIQAFKMAGAGSNNGGEMVINLNVNGQKFASATLDDFAQEISRRGGISVDLVGV